jgi:hypothetical protein
MQEPTEDVCCRGCRCWTIFCRSWLLIGCLYVGELEACEPPRYRVAKLIDRDDAVFGYVSIRLQDFAPQNVACLADELRRRYPDRDLDIYLFSSHTAAQSYVPEGVEALPLTYASKLHGTYNYHRGQSVNYLTLLPAGAVEGAEHLWTRLELPLRHPVPNCTLHIGSRCLLALELVDYPSVRGKYDTSGRITLAGRINKGGRVSGLRVVEVEATHGGDSTMLVGVALTNLKTWRFARDDRDQDIRITYRFDPTPGPTRHRGAYMEFRLPSEVTVRP